MQKGVSPAWSGPPCVVMMSMGNMAPVADPTTLRRVTAADHSKSRAFFRQAKRKAWLAGDLAMAAGQNTQEDVAAHASTSNLDTIRNPHAGIMNTPLRTAQTQPCRPAWLKNPYALLCALPPRRSFFQSSFAILLTENCCIALALACEGCAICPSPGGDLVRGGSCWCRSSPRRCPRRLIFFLRLRSRRA